MITKINKAILHILDYNSDIIVYSDDMLNVDEVSIYDYLCKHIEKSNMDSNCKRGNFFENSYLLKILGDYQEGQISFVKLSTQIAEKVNSGIGDSDKKDSSDLIICEYSTERDQYISILIFKNRIGYTHHVQNSDGKIVNNIVRHHAILPSISQKIEGCAHINLKTKKLTYMDNKRYVNGRDVFIIPEMILECDSQFSSNEMIKIVKDVALKVADSHGENTALTVSKIKSYIADNAEISNVLDVNDLSNDVFDYSETQRNEFLIETKKAGLTKPVQIEKKFALRTGKSHKIRTDTGIELVIPVEFYRDPNYIEFVNNPDGTLSIEVKNIGKISNK